MNISAWKQCSGTSSLCVVLELFRGYIAFGIKERFPISGVKGGKYFYTIYTHIVLPKEVNSFQIS